MVSPYNPHNLVWTEGKPSPHALILFYDAGTDVPKEVKYTETSATTDRIIADEAGQFSQVELLSGDYDLRAYVLIDPLNPSPVFPDDYAFHSTWTLSGPSIVINPDTPETIALNNIGELRNYDGTATNIWIGNRLFIKTTAGSLADNNGTWIVSSALDNTAWRMDLTGYDHVDVTWFGTDGTGATDATANILQAQSAIGQMASQTPEKRLPSVLYLPAGTYKITSDFSFNYKVEMDKGARFYNPGNTAYTITFNDGLETENTSPWTGTSAIIFKFSTGTWNGKPQRVLTTWYNNSAMDGDNFAIPVDIRGSGQLSTNNRKVVINSLYITGEFNLRPNTTYPIEVNEVTGSKHLLKNGGTGYVVFKRLPISYLYDTAQLERMRGELLELDEDLTLTSNTTLSFDQIIGTKNPKPKIQYTTGFATVDLDWKGKLYFDTVEAHLHDINYKKAVKPSDLDWSDADSDDWANFFYDQSVLTDSMQFDMGGLTTSGDINLQAYSYEISNLNHTGTLQAAKLSLRHCVIALGSTKELKASAEMEIFDSSVTGSSAGNQIKAPKISIMNSNIGANILVDGGGDIDFVMMNSNFSYRIALSTSQPLKRLIAKNNIVSNVDFIEQTPVIASLPDNHSIDVSENSCLAGLANRTRGYGYISDSNTTPTVKSLGFIDFVDSNGYSYYGYIPRQHSVLTASAANNSGATIETATNADHEAIFMFRNHSSIASTRLFHAILWQNNEYPGHL